MTTGLLSPLYSPSSSRTSWLRTGHCCIEYGTSVWKIGRNFLRKSGRNWTRLTNVANTSQGIAFCRPVSPWPRGCVSGGHQTPAEAGLLSGVR